MPWRESKRFKGLKQKSCWASVEVYSLPILTKIKIKTLLTSFHRPLASPWCWSWCGNQHHSSSQESVWGQRTQPRRNLHTLCAGWSEPSTDGLPCWYLHKFPPGTPTGTHRRGHFKHWVTGRRQGNLWTTHLSWHDFGVAAADLHPGVETGSVVCLHNVSSIHLVCSHTAVIRPWSGRKAALHLCWTKILYV